MGWFITITEEMRDMGLSGNNLMVYALINNFSQKSLGCYVGGIDYIADVCGIAKRTAYYIVNDLLDKGFIDRTETIWKGERVTAYFAVQKLHESVQNLHESVQKLHTDIYNNNITSNNTSNYIYNKRGFNFKKSLLEIGVSEAVAEAWLQVRKTKRATNTEIAFNKVRAEIEKSGLAADAAIKLAVENSWSGFKAEWLSSPTNQERKNVAPKKKESVFEHNLKVMDEMFGTNLHSQTYGKKEECDEQ